MELSYHVGCELLHIKVYGHSHLLLLSIISYIFLEKSKTVEMDEHANSSDAARIEKVTSTLKDKHGETNAADCQGNCTDGSYLIMILVNCKI